MKENQNKKSYVYGVIGAIALVLIGGVAGYIVNGSDHVNRSVMSEEQCKTLARKLSYAVDNSRYDDIEKINKLYSENCLDRDFEQTKPAPKPEVKKLPEETCAAIEELLGQDLANENSMDAYEHQQNFEVYTKMAEKGCEKNKEKYLKLAQREKDIAEALKSEDHAEPVYNIVESSTCEQIESLLGNEVNRYSLKDSQERIERAKIYANLAERGCPENSQKYKNLAAQELEIARALYDDNLNQERESVEIVETYKRLQMQAEAMRMIEKAKKLTNPAIDFIIQLEKIIEE